MESCWPLVLQANHTIYEEGFDIVYRGHELEATVTGGHVELCSQRYTIQKHTEDSEHAQLEAQLRIVSSIVLTVENPSESCVCSTSGFASGTKWCRSNGCYRSYMDGIANIASLLAECSNLQHLVVKLKPGAYNPFTGLGQTSLSIPEVEICAVLLPFSRIRNLESAKLELDPEAVICKLVQARNARLQY